MRKKILPSKLESEKLRKKKLAEEEEKLDAMGQESEHRAAKYVIEEGVEYQKKQKKIIDDELTKLEDVIKVPSYKKFLLWKLHDLIAQINMKSNWQWGVWFDGKGIVIGVIRPDKKLYKRAFRLTYDPKYDYNACYEFARWVEDLYDQTLQTYRGNIWTPNKPN